MASELDIKVNGSSLDLFDNEEQNFYLTKQIHDLQNLETRNADFSKTIGIPLTVRNQEILGDSVPSLERFSIDPVVSLPCEVLIKGIPVLEDATILIGEETTEARVLQISVIAGSARFFNQLQDIPIANLNYSELNIEWTLAGITPITTATTGIVYAQSIWYSNKSRSLFDAKGGIGLGFGNYLDNMELGESGFYIYLKTVLDKIFANLDNLTVDDSKLDTLYNTSALAVAVPIVHDSFVDVNGYFVEVATPHIPFDEVLYSQLVEYNSVLSDDDALFTPPYTVTIAVASFCVIKASFDVLRNANFPYYTRIQVLVNGNIIGDERFEYTGNASDVIECSITTSANLVAGDTVQVQIANQQGAYITDNSTGVFSVEAQGSGRGRYLEVASVLPEITQRDFVKEVFKLFNIIPTTKNRVITLNYFEEIGSTPAKTFEINKLKETSVKASLFSYGQSNILKYTDNEDVERLDANSSFNVNSNTLAKTVIKIESLYTPTDQSLIPPDPEEHLILSVPNYELEWWLVTDNKLTVALGSPNYSTADRNNIELGDFIYSEAGTTVRKRVIAIIDDFSGICDANFESNAPSFDWQHWRYTKNDLMMQIAQVVPSVPSPSRVLVWDGSFSNRYDNMLQANFDGLKWQDLQIEYYQLLVDAMFKPFIVTAWVHLETVKFVSINGLEPIYVEEFDAYFYANKIEQWKYNGNTRVELIQIPI